MFCQNCGSKINDGASFCENCGNPTNASAQPGAQSTAPSQPQAIPPAQPGIQAAAQAPVNQAPIQPMQQSGMQPAQAGAQPGLQSEKRSKAPIVIIACVAAAAVVALAIFLVLTFVINPGDDGSSQASTGNIQAVEGESDQAEEDESSSGKSSSSKSSSSSTSSGSSKSSGSFDVEDISNLDFLLSSKGADAAKELERLGFKWDGKNNSYALESGNATYHFSALGKDEKALSQKEFESQPTLASEKSPAAYRIMILGGDPEEAISPILQKAAYKSIEGLNKGRGTSYILVNPNGKYTSLVYFVDAKDSNGGEMIIYNNAYVKAGYMQDGADEGKTGMDCKTFFNNVSAILQKSGWKLTDHS